MIQCFASSPPDILLFGEPGLLLKVQKQSVFPGTTSPLLRIGPRCQRFLTPLNESAMLSVASGPQEGPGSKDAFRRLTYAT